MDKCLTHHISMGYMGSITVNNMKKWLKIIKVVIHVDYNLFDPYNWTKCHVEFNAPSTKIIKKARAFGNLLSSFVKNMVRIRLLIKKNTSHCNMDTTHAFLSNSQIPLEYSLLLVWLRLSARISISCKANVVARFNAMTGFLCS